MNFSLHILLNANAEQTVRLQELQTAFAEVCNALAPVAQQNRCWNRVALHHLAYHGLRERFPQMGSQMVCNAIYSVSRSYRLVLQHPASPWNIAKNPEQAIPLIHFQPGSPVYFDRHTLSLKKGQLSMYTLDGRMRFQLELKAEDQARFERDKLREIVLERVAPGFRLSFWFSPAAAGNDARDEGASATGELPEYLLVVPEESSASETQKTFAQIPPNAGLTTMKENMKTIETAEVRA
jgi:hypothetical protein